MAEPEIAAPLQPVIEALRKAYLWQRILGAASLVSGVLLVAFGSGAATFGGGVGIVAGLILLPLGFRDPRKRKLVQWLAQSPERIVWMYEVTGTRENGVRIFREDGEHDFLEIVGPDRTELVAYLRGRLPHAHFGYDEAGRARIKKR